MPKIVFIFFLGLALGMARAGEAFELRAGDRVVLVGDTLIEREQESGWLETALDTAFAERRFQVRNLGWSADTPAGQSRASFDFADRRKGFERLTQQVAEARPSVVFLGYGMASSFAGEAGLAEFKADLDRLIDTIQRGATQQVRFVVFSPLRHQKLPPPLPDPASHNAALRLYTEALRDAARARGFAFVDLFDWKPAGRTRDATDDGIHLTPAGYRLMAAEVAWQLGWKARLKGEAVEELRQAIIRKNQLFFDRWRPENQTYLLGFRANEQGKNARELPEFDPLIQALEDQIFRAQQRIGERRGRPAQALPVTPAKVSPSFPLPAFDIAPGFEINLWAQDPLLAKPTQMNFDPKGRLWVATSSIYPQISPGQQANDKIVVLEDTCGAGHADKSTVFADGLFIPTGVEPGDGGCYVGQSTELLHYSAGRGAGRADRRRVVLSGFGTEDSHHMVHTLCWGPDGMLYLNQSIYIHSHIEMPRGVVRLNSGGIFHLRPPTMELGVFLRGFCNPWGHQFDAFGQSFVSDGAGYQGISWGIPGATYFTYAEMRREMASISPGQYPKFCGLEIVASRQFPDDWQGDFLTADFRAHRLARFTCNEEGAGYVTKEMPDVLRTTNETFRPVDLKWGPDGALYVADWCNPIINHGEVDFRDSRRDHEHGRIWRITAKGRPLTARRDLSGAPSPALLQNLLSSNAYDVQQSRRVLTERGRGILSALKKWTARQSDEAALLQALWMYQSIDVRNDALLDRLLRAGDGHVRAAAVRVLSYWPRPSGTEPDECYERALQDPFPRVRVEALRAVARLPSLRSAQWALETLHEPMDPFVDYALWLTINDLAQPWLDGVRSGQWKIDGREKQLTFAFNAIDPDLAAPYLRELLRKQKWPRDGRGPWIELIGRAGTADEVQLLYNKILEQGFNAAAAKRAWAALSEAAARNVQPAAGVEKVGGFFNDADAETRLQAIRLAGDWKAAGGCFTNLVSLATAAPTAAPVRAAAFVSLRKMGGAETIAALRPFAAAGQPWEIRRPAVLTLAALDLTNSGAAAISLLTAMTNHETALDTWRSLLGNVGAGPVLAAALPHSGFPQIAGQAGIRAVREGDRSEPELVVALTRAAGLQGGETELSKLEIMRLAEAVLNQGSAARGELIFRRGATELHDVPCHRWRRRPCRPGHDLAGRQRADRLFDRVGLLPEQADQRRLPVVSGGDQGRRRTGRHPGARERARMGAAHRGRPGRHHCQGPNCQEETWRLAHALGPDGQFEPRRAVGLVPVLVRTRQSRPV